MAKKSGNLLGATIIVLGSFFAGALVSHFAFPKQEKAFFPQPQNLDQALLPSNPNAAREKSDFLQAVAARDVRRMRSNFSRTIDLSKEELLQAKSTLESMPSGNIRNALLSEVLGLLLRQGESPNEMMIAARRLPTNNGRSFSTMRVLEEWLSADAASAIDWIERTPTASFTPLELVRIQRLVNEVDSDAGQRFQQRLPRTWLAESADESLLREARRGNFLSAADKALLIDSTQREATLHGILQIWAVTDPGPAAEFVLKMPSDAASERLLETVLFTWGLSQQQQAMLWAEALPPGRMRQAALAGVLKALARVDQKGAVAAGILRPDDDVSQRVLDLLWADFAVKNRSLALEWLVTLPDNPRKRRLTTLILRAWATEDPSGASSYAMSLTDAVERENAVRSLIDTVMIEQPAQAVSMAMSLSPGSARTELLTDAMSVWAIIDPVSSLNWLQGQPAGAERDVMYSSLSRSLFEVNPDAAMDAGLQIGNQQVRASFLLDLLKTWSREDIQSASQWLNSAPLAPDFKNYLHQNSGIPFPMQPVAPVRAAES